MPQTDLHADKDERRLLVLRAGGKLFGIYTDALAHGSDSDGGFTAPTPVPLPGAPPSVRGVVQVRGRLYTVIDPVLMLDASSDGKAAQVPSDAMTPTLVVPLRGKEQLAIAVESIEETVNITVANIESLEAAMPAVQGIVRGISEGDVLVLDTGGLFAAATHGMERRRRRS